MGEYNIVYLGVFVRVRRGIWLYINRDCVDSRDLSCGCRDDGAGDRRG